MIKMGREELQVFIYYVRKKYKTIGMIVFPLLIGIPLSGIIIYFSTTMLFQNTSMNPNVEAVSIESNVMFDNITKVTTTENTKELIKDTKIAVKASGPVLFNPMNWKNEIEKKYKIEIIQSAVDSSISDDCEMLVKIADIFDNIFQYNEGTIYEKFDDFTNKLESEYENISFINLGEFREFGADIGNKSYRVRQFSGKKGEGPNVMSFDGKNFLKVYFTFKKMGDYDWIVWQMLQAEDLEYISLNIWANYKKNDIKMVIRNAVEGLIYLKDRGYLLNLKPDMVIIKQDPNDKSIKDVKLDIFENIEKVANPQDPRLDEENLKTVTRLYLKLINGLYDRGFTGSPYKNYLSNDKAHHIYTDDPSLADLALVLEGYSQYHITNIQDIFKHSFFSGLPFDQSNDIYGKRDYRIY